MPLKISSSVVQQGEGCDARCMIATFDEVWSGDRDGGVTIRQVDTGEILGRKRYTGASAWALCEVGAHVWVGFSNGSVVVFRASTQQPVHEIHPPASINQTGGVQCLLHTNGAVFVGYGNAAVLQYHAQKFHQLQLFRGHSEAVRCLLTRRGALYTGANDGLISAWDLTTGKKTLEVAHEHGAVYALANTYSHIWSAGGVTGQGVLKLWDPNTHKLVKTIEYHAAPIVTLVAADRLWAGSWDGALSLWCPRQLHLLQHIPSPAAKGPPRAVQANPFGHSPATGALTPPSGRSPRGSALGPIPQGSVEVMSVLHVNSAKTTRVWVATSDKVLRKLCTRVPEGGEDVYEEPAARIPVTTISEGGAPPPAAAIPIQDALTPQGTPNGSPRHGPTLRLPANATPTNRTPNVSPKRHPSGRRDSSSSTGKARGLEDALQRVQFENERLQHEQGVYRQAAQDALSFIGGSLTGIPLSKIKDEVHACGRRWRADNSTARRQADAHQGLSSAERREKDEWEERAQRYHRESALLAAKIAVLESKLAQANEQLSPAAHPGSPENQTTHTPGSAFDGAVTPLAPRQILPNGASSAAETPPPSAAPLTAAEIPAAGLGAAGGDSELRRLLVAESAQKMHWKDAAERSEKRARELAEELEALAAMKTQAGSGPDVRKVRIAADEVAQRVRAEFEERLLAETRAKYKMQGLAEQHEREKQRLQKEVADLRAQSGAPQPTSSNRLGFNRQLPAPADVRTRADLEARLAAEARSKQRLQEICERQDKEAKALTRELTELRTQAQLAAAVGPLTSTIPGTPQGCPATAPPPIPMHLGKAGGSAAGKKPSGATGGQLAEAEHMLAVENQVRLHWQSVVKRHQTEIAALQQLAASRDPPAADDAPVAREETHPWQELAAVREKEMHLLAEKLARAQVALESRVSPARGAAPMTPEQIVLSPPKAPGTGQLERYWEEVAGAREREVQLLAETLAKARQELQQVQQPQGGKPAAEPAPPATPPRQGSSAPRHGTPVRSPEGKQVRSPEGKQGQWQELAQARENELKVMSQKVESLQENLRKAPTDLPPPTSPLTPTSPTSPMNEVLVSGGKVVKCREQRELDMETKLAMEESRSQTRQWQHIAAQQEKEMQALKKKLAAVTAEREKVDGYVEGLRKQLRDAQAAAGAAGSRRSSSPPPFDDDTMFVSNFKAFADGQGSRRASEVDQLRDELAVSLSQLEQAEEMCMNYAEMYHKAISEVTGNGADNASVRTPNSDIMTMSSCPPSAAAAPLEGGAVNPPSRRANFGRVPPHEEQPDPLTWFAALPDCQGCEFLFLAGQQQRGAALDDVLSELDELRKENADLRVAMESNAAGKDTLVLALHDARTFMGHLRGLGGAAPASGSDSASCELPQAVGKPAEHEEVMNGLAALEGRIFDALTQSETAYLHPGELGHPHNQSGSAVSVISDSRDTAAATPLRMGGDAHLAAFSSRGPQDSRDVEEGPLLWFASLPDCHGCEYLFLAAQAARIDDPVLCGEYHDMMVQIAGLETRLADAQEENLLLVHEIRRRHGQQADASPLAWLASRQEATACEFLFLAAQSHAGEVDPALSLEYAGLRRQVMSLEGRLDEANAAKSELVRKLPAARDEGASPLAWLASLPECHPCEALFLAAQAERSGLPDEVCAEYNTMMRSIADLEARCADLAEERDALAAARAGRADSSVLDWFSALPDCQPCEFLFLATLSARAAGTDTTYLEAHALRQTVGRLEGRVEDLEAERRELARKLTSAGGGGGSDAPYSQALTWLTGLPECQQCEFLFLAALSDRVPDCDEVVSMQKRVAMLEGELDDVKDERIALRAELEQSKARLDAAARAGIAAAPEAETPHARSRPATPPGGTRSATPPRKVVKVVKKVVRTPSSGGAVPVIERSTTARSASVGGAEGSSARPRTPQANGITASAAREGEAPLREAMRLVEVQRDQAEALCVAYAEQCYAAEAAAQPGLKAALSASRLKQGKVSSPPRARGGVSFAAAATTRNRAVSLRRASRYCVHSTRLQTLLRYYAQWLRLYAERSHFYMLESVREKIEDIQRSASPVEVDMDWEVIMQRVLAAAADAPPSRGPSEATSGGAMEVA